MSGNGNGYQSGGMQQGYGGYSSGGYGGQQSSGYGNGGYQPGMNSGGYQQSGQYGGMNGGFGQQQQGFQPWGNSMYSGNQWPQFGGWGRQMPTGRQQQGYGGFTPGSNPGGPSMVPQTDNIGASPPGVSQINGQMDYSNGGYQTPGFVPPGVQQGDTGLDGGADPMSTWRAQLMGRV